MSEVRFGLSMGWLGWISGISAQDGGRQTPSCISSGRQTRPPLVSADQVWGHLLIRALTLAKGKTLKGISFTTSDQE